MNQPQLNTKAHASQPLTSNLSHSSYDEDGLWAIERLSIDDQQWNLSDLFSKGQCQEKTERALTGLISWNVLEAVGQKNSSFKQDPNQSHVLYSILEDIRTDADVLSEAAHSFTLGSLRNHTRMNGYYFCHI